MRNAIVLAAGRGTRMKSDTSKVMHEIIDRPMLSYSIEALKKAGVDRIILIVGHQHEAIEAAFPNLETALQEPQLGSGHAVMQATALKGEPGQTVVINGDGPCIQPETIEALFETGKDAGMVVLTSILEDGKHYGRVLKNPDGTVSAIVEAKDCTPEQLDVKEINAGMYCFDNKALFDGLEKLDNNNSQHEYYITDLAEIISDMGLPVRALPCDQDQTMGINDPAELAVATAWIRDKINLGHMKNGVQMDDPARTVIGPDVKIGKNVRIWPGVELTGNTVLEDNVKIRSGSRLHNAQVKQGAAVESSRILNAVVNENEKVGPFKSLGQEME